MHAQTSPPRRHALVTGASYGIGAAIALELARNGFDVAVTARQLENLTAVVAKIEASGARAVPLALDVRSHSSIKLASEAAIGAFDQLDLLVNNAGIPMRKAALEITPDDWDAVIETNVRGTFFMCQRLAGHFIERRLAGCIVNLGSTHGTVGYAGVAAYGISKAAITHLTKTLAVEWAEHGIRVNAVAPGTVDTPTRAAVTGDAKLRQGILNSVPLHRLGTVEEVAAAVLFLASPAATYITGQTLLVDGGVTACGARGIGPK